MSALYRDKSLSRMASPEQLDKMVSTVKPSWSLALIGTVLVVGVVLLWGMFGRVPVYTYVECVETTGLDDTALFVSQDNAKKLEKGMKIIYSDGSTGKIDSIGDHVVSTTELKREFGSIPDELAGKSYVMLECSCDNQAGNIDDAQIVLCEVTPFEKLMMKIK